MHKGDKVKCELVDGVNWVSETLLFGYNKLSLHNNIYVSSCSVNYSVITVVVFILIALKLTKLKR